MLRLDPCDGAGCQLAEVATWSIEMVSLCEDWLVRRRLTPPPELIAGFRIAAAGPAPAGDLPGQLACCCSAAVEQLRVSGFLTTFARDLSLYAQSMSGTPLRSGLTICVEPALLIPVLAADDRRLFLPEWLTRFQGANQLSASTAEFPRPIQATLSWLLFQSLIWKESHAVTETASVLLSMRESD